MEPEKKEYIILVSIMLGINIITWVSWYFRNAFNGKMLIVSGCLMGLAFITNIIASIVRTYKVIEYTSQKGYDSSYLTGNHKHRSNIMIAEAVIFALASTGILLYLIYYYISTDCNNK
jgi:hypothetical protein